MEHLITGQVTVARAEVKTGLTVYLAEIALQNLLNAIGQFLGPVKKGNQSSTREVHGYNLDDFSASREV